MPLPLFDHAVLMQECENGIYPDHDRALSRDTKKLLVLDPQACSVCRTITIAALTKRVPPFGFRHQPSQAHLLHSAYLGCRLCIWVCYAMFLEPGQVDNSGIKAPVPGREEHATGNAFQYPPILRYSTSFGGIRVLNPFEVTERNIMRVYTDLQNPAVSVIRSRRVHNISTIELSLNRFAPQLQAKEVVTVLPRRVIDVGEKSDKLVTLRDFGSSPPAGHYICLSHRWQRSCPSTTTQVNIDTRKSGIRMTELSATLRDAILLTRALRVRYLWIDSLCILQDSDTDWEIESSKMGAYYGRSWLTIAAALDSETILDPGYFRRTSSIFGPRYKESTRAGYYRLQLADSIRRSYLYFNLEDELSHDNRSSSYLFSRGWTLQEEALPARFLSFQPRQTTLRVGEKIYHESGFTQKVSETSFITTNGTDIKTWAGLIEDYTTRSLTKEGDKLSALSGIAQFYHTKCKDKYLAGLWYRCLLEHLCWCVPGSVTDTNRPSAYRAPTWSWASIDGQVTFDRSVSQNCEIKIIEATTTPAGEDPFGQVQDGSIKLEAQMSQQHWKRDTDWKRRWYYASPYDERASSMNTAATPFSNATLLLDVRDPKANELELWSLPIHDQFALALQAIDSQENYFRRIGAICWRSEKDDANLSEPTVITIT